MNDIRNLTSNDEPAQPASRVTGWITRAGDGGWKRVRTSKPFRRSDNAPNGGPQTRFDRLAGCNGPVRQLMKDGQRLVDEEGEK